MVQINLEWPCETFPWQNSCFEEGEPDRTLKTSSICISCLFISYSIYSNLFLAIA